MSTSMDASFPFLNLTRELRDSVYQSLLLSSRVPPESPEHSGPRKYPSNEDQDLFEYHNHYPADGLKSTDASLLLTCRQISKEVKEAVIRLSNSNCSLYKLDLMLLDERELYINWLAYPHSTPRISRLDVDFRLLGDVKGKKTTLKGGFDGPPVLIWGLFTLIERFLLRGPDFLAPRQQGRDSWIEELSVNVLTPPSPPLGGYADGKNYKRDRKGHISPTDMVQFLISYMEILLRRSKHTAPYARLVFERIKRMTFSLDGVERKRWDLATLEPESTG
ncbi:MAG: hypothetical protein L6R35_003854 [Caloplaca aegaea]|nr:MAG: hypothetical protein L6R35_003854 [Caloplaca aegaea]